MGFWPIVAGFVALAVIIKLLEWSPLNDFGNEIIVTYSPEEREVLVEQVAQMRRIKPRWRVNDEKTSQVFLVSWFQRIHILNSTDDEVNSFMKGASRASARTYILNDPKKEALKLIKEMSGNPETDLYEYKSNQVEPGSMYFVRVGENDPIIVRYWGPRMGGGLSRYKGYEL